MKINWGYGIAIFYVVFMAAMIFAVIRSTGVDHSLVTKEYYKEDINYQKHYDKIQNAAQLETDLQINPLLRDKEIHFEFPKDLGPVSGQILFFRPSNSKMDINIPISTDEEMRTRISTQELASGLWKMKVDWQADGKKFYKEDDVIIP